MSTAIQEKIIPLLAVAREQEAEVANVEQALRDDYDRLLSSNWHLGKTLNQIKAVVGHSRWLIWLGANMKDLAGSDGRRAQRIMGLYLDNEQLAKPNTVAEFNVDSVRRFLGGYMPAKLRPTLAGDQKLPQVLSFDSGTNRFAAAMQRIREGHATAPPWDTVAPQVKLIIEGLREIYGEERLGGLM